MTALNRHIQTIVAACVGIVAASPTAAEIKSDERVIFFTTAATVAEDGEHLDVPIHGWIFEPERDSVWRNGLVGQIASQVDVKPDTAEGQRLADRAGMFIVDNERGKQIAIRIAGRTVTLDESTENGHFTGSVRLTRKEADAHAVDGLLRFEAVTEPSDRRRFPGRAVLPPANGIGVVSDIDDTIKVSHVRDTKKLLRKTFVEPFEAVEEMAAAYRAWAEKGATFHYVSSSPWQLYPALSAFMDDARFPVGAMHLRDVRLKDSTLLNLFASPLDTKPAAIEQLLKRYPGHRFILVGDSGEMDPEAYGQIVRQHPHHIIHIYIRKAPDADESEARYARAFEGVAKEKWTVFDDSASLRAITVPAAP